MRDDLRELLTRALEQALTYREGLAGGLASPALGYHAARQRFLAPVPETGMEPVQMLEELAALAAPGLMPTAGPRFFGWVMGAAHPAGVAADWLVSAWGQNAGYQSTAPAAAAIEEVAESWLLDILDLPRESAIGFTTGATLANVTCLAAARTHVLRTAGWDPDADGLFGAPPVHVLVGADSHSSIFSALQLIGFGRNRVTCVATDDQGRMIAPALAEALQHLDGPRIVIAQAGQINTGAFDPFAEIVEVARAGGAWVHVDGAFGLWARAAPSLRHLTAGIEGCDSWVTDGHKWLQVPYDSGFAIVRNREALLGAMTQWSSYLPAIADGDRVPSNLVPELSRRARGIPVYALLKTLGRSGIAEMVENHCRLAARLGERLSREPGIRVHNDVAINQLIVGFGRGDAGARKAATEAVTARVLQEGVLFAAGAQWREDWVMRLSVTSGVTSEADIDLAAEAIIGAWRAVQMG
jgi:glutamate/tyrosine decarboxylase-like PLP-dependent enzyme